MKLSVEEFIEKSTKQKFNSAKKFVITHEILRDMIRDYNYKYGRIKVKHKHHHCSGDRLGFDASGY